MSEALIASLNKRISELEDKNSNLNAALKQSRIEVREYKPLIAELDEQLKQARVERDQWKTKAEAGPTEQSARIVELEGLLAGRDHRDAFRAAAITAGVDSHFVDDLYTLSGLKPGDSPVKPENFVEFFTAAKTARPWAFGNTQPSGQNGAAQPSGQNGNTQGIGLTGTVPPPGAGRSASVASVNGVRYTADEVRRPGWQQSRPELVEALQRGTAVFVE